jgi:Helix-turn-helix domain
MSSAYQIKTFRDRDDWIKHILAVGELSAAAKVVAVRLAMHLNVETGQCNPSIEKLVSGTGMSESTVRRMIRDELEAEGWIGVDRTRGRHTNSFDLRSPTLPDVTGLNPVTCDGVQDSPTLSNRGSQPCQIRPNPVTADTRIRESRTENRTAKARGAQKARPRRSLSGEGEIPLPTSMTESMSTRALERAGWNSDRANLEFDKFRNRCLSSGKRSHDWDAEFALWIERGVEHKPKRMVKQGPMIDQQGNPVAPPPHSGGRSHPSRQSNQERGRAMFGGGK